MLGFALLHNSDRGIMGLAERCHRGGNTFRDQGDVGFNKTRGTVASKNGLKTSNFEVIFFSYYHEVIYIKKDTAHSRINMISKSHLMIYLSILSKRKANSHICS